MFEGKLLIEDVILNDVFENGIMVGRLNLWFILEDFIMIGDIKCRKYELVYLGGWRRRWGVYGSFEWGGWYFFFVNIVCLVFWSLWVEIL